MPAIAEIPTTAATAADLDEFHNFALAQVSRGDSVSVVQLAKRWTEERELQEFIRAVNESNEQFEQGLGRPIEELHVAMRAKIAAMRALASNTEAAP